jgi:hypothetical protein
MKLIFGVMIDEDGIEEDMSDVSHADDEMKDFIARDIVKRYILDNADYWWRFEDEEE